MIFDNGQARLKWDPAQHVPVCERTGCTLTDPGARSLYCRNVGPEIIQSFDKVLLLASDEAATRTFAIKGDDGSVEVATVQPSALRLGEDPAAAAALSQDEEDLVAPPTLPSTEMISKWSLCIKSGKDIYQIAGLDPTVDTLEHLKCRISEASGSPPDKIKLFLKGAINHPPLTLISDTQLKDGSKLTMVVSR